MPGRRTTGADFHCLKATFRCVDLDHSVHLVGYEFDDRAGRDDFAKQGRYRRYLAKRNCTFETVRLEMESLFPILGFAMIGAVLLQFAMWAGRSWQLGILDRRRYEAELELLRVQIEEIAARRDSNPQLVTAKPDDLTSAVDTQRQISPEPKSSWTGFRKFQVHRLERETETAVSVYLRPVEDFPLPFYQPGQHLTVRVNVPGADKPVVRCYTLSDAPCQDVYRVTVKQLASAAHQTDARPGLVSGFFNQNLSVGDQLEAKPPGGKFFLQPGKRPVVLLAGGIGITPMVSIINHLAATGSSRECLLVYGVRNGSDLNFGRHLSSVSRQHENVHLIKCYSDPLPTESPNEDYHVEGHVSVEVLRKVLSSSNCDFYLCGPPPFMNSLYSGLLDWGVPDSQIQFEAFGPASIGQRSVAGDDDEQSPQIEGNENSQITFRRTGQIETWSGDAETLLDFCESRGVPIDSGCRAGSCGTCAIRLVSGQVRYLDDAEECPDGHVFPCIAVPDGSVEIDA